MSGKRKYAVLTKAQGKIVTSLIKKGYSQKYAAKKIKIAKKSVSIFVKKRKIGKRVKGGAKEFWEDVKGVKLLKEITRKEAIKEVKFAPKWFKRRQARLKGVDKARDKMREKWQRIGEGKIDMTFFTETEEGEELLEGAGYD